MLFRNHTSTHITLSIAIIFLMLASLVVSSSSAHAQELAVKIQPITIEERLDPGQSKDGELTITNESGGLQTYFIGTQNITSQDENGRPIFSELASDDPLEAASWIVPQTKSISLGVGESATVPYTIHVPQNASPGSYFAAFFVTREADKTTESGAGVGFQVASIVTLRVNGNAFEGIELKEFSTDRSAYTDRTVTFSTRISNTGTVHERPVGFISITNMLGNEIVMDPPLTFNEKSGVVMPRDERTFKVTWNGEGFQFGRYTATLSVGYGEVDKWTVTRMTTFWILPVKEIGLFAGGMLGVLLLTTIGLRAYVRRALRRAGIATHTQEADRIESFPKRLIRTLTWFMVLVVVVFIAVVVFFA